MPYRCTPPVCFTVNNFSKLKAEKTKWHSPDLYTHEQGYKIYFLVFLNEASTHVGVEVCGKRGEYDAQLRWPARASFTLQLLNQHSDHDHFTKECKSTCYRTKKSTVLIFRDDSFIYLADLEWKAHKQRQCYLKNDCLVFCLQKVEIK